MFNYEGYVKRSELQLRLETVAQNNEIYQIDEHKYMIFCSGIGENLLSVSNYYDMNIRMIGCNFVLSDERPTAFLRQIETLDEKCFASTLEGITITWPDIECILVSKFYDIKFISIYEDPINREVLVIEIDSNTDDKLIENLKNFIVSLKLFFTSLEIKKVNKVEVSKELSQFDVLSCVTDPNFEFSKRDSEFWFDNFENIYTGKLKVHDLSSFNPNASKCYLDLSGFQNINLRNFILLYDVVYFAPPLEDKIFSFLETQNITIEDIIELANRGRIVLLLVNSESRYNKDLINGVYKANPDAIFTKRAINALLASYFTQLSDNYIFSGLEDFRLLMELRKNIDNQNKLLKNLISLWMWPTKAKMESFRFLNFSSPLTLSSIGINNLALESYYEFNEKAKTTNSYEFEFTVNYSNIQIATALQATYFPFYSEGKTYSDSGVANILGTPINR